MCNYRTRHSTPLPRPALCTSGAENRAASCGRCILLTEQCFCSQGLEIDVKFCHKTS